MCLKICKHLDIKNTYKILRLGFPEHFSFRVFRLLSREDVFLAIFVKNMVDPLGAKNIEGNIL